MEPQFDILPSDILRLIILISKINVIKIISSTNKYFYSLCCEKNLWLEKFNEKDLIIINDKIITVGEYLNEYRKISYATYTANCLINMIVCDKYEVTAGICCFNRYFSDNDLRKIFNKKHPIFTKLKDSNKKYVDMFLRIKEKSLICFDAYKTNNEIDQNDEDIEIDIFSENYNNTRIISLISKILYYFPLTTMNDIGYSLLIISKNMKFDTNYENRFINRRKEYWDQCYPKYEELYF